MKPTSMQIVSRFRIEGSFGYSLVVLLFRYLILSAWCLLLVVRAYVFAFVTCFRIDTIVFLSAIIRYHDFFIKKFTPAPLWKNDKALCFATADVTEYVKRTDNLCEWNKIIVVVLHIQIKVRDEIFFHFFPGYLAQGSTDRCANLIATFDLCKSIYTRGIRLGLGCPTSARPLIHHETPVIPGMSWVPGMSTKGVFYSVAAYFCLCVSLKISHRQRLLFQYPSQYFYEYRMECVFWSCLFFYFATPKSPFPFQRFLPTLELPM